MMNLKPGEYLRRMTFHLVIQTARTKNIRVLPTYLTYDLLVTLQILYHYAK